MNRQAEESDTSTHDDDDNGRRVSVTTDAEVCILAGTSVFYDDRHKCTLVPCNQPSDEDAYIDNPVGRRYKRNTREQSEYFAHIPCAKRTATRQLPRVHTSILNGVNLNINQDEFKAIDSQSTLDATTESKASHGGLSLSCEVDDTHVTFSGDTSHFRQNAHSQSRGDQSRIDAHAQCYAKAHGIDYVGDDELGHLLKLWSVVDML